MLDAPGWEQELKEYSKIRDPEPWLAHAIRDRAVTLEHASLLNFDYKRVKFNKRVYTDWNELKNADIPNYKSAEVITEPMLASWANAGIIRLAREEEIPYVTINPLHAVNTDKSDLEAGRKPRFILHTKINAISKRQPTRLEAIRSSLDRILRMKSGVVLDARKAFYQIRIAESSERLCGFKIFGQVWVARVLTFGCSTGTHICNQLISVPVFNWRLQNPSAISVQWAERKL